MALTGKSGDNLLRLAGGVATAADCTQEFWGVRVFHIFVGVPMSGCHRRPGCILNAALRTHVAGHTRQDVSGTDHAQRMPESASYSGLSDLNPYMYNRN